jgi:ABC-type enterochelin transport system ATPase subunit
MCLVTHAELTELLVLLLRSRTRVSELQQLGHLSYSQARHATRAHASLTDALEQLALLELPETAHLALVRGDAGGPPPADACIACNGTGRLRLTS